MSTAAPPAFLATARGKLTLALLCAVGFLDFVDASIVNIALPHIRDDLHFSRQDLQWVLSGYVLTYGGFMLLGGRIADLLGRRRVLVTGTVLFAISSLVGGFAGEPGVLVGARLAQGLGAALMMPTALSLLTTLFTEGTERTKALGVWGGVAGLASAAGVLLGGVLSEGPGWRWVLFVNPPVALLLLVAIFRLIPGERRAARLANFDITGTVLGTGGMLMLVYALVKAPEQSWGSARTVGELAAGGVLLAAFVLNERRSRNPLVPMSIFRVRGLAMADITQFIGVGGFATMFYFLTLYMQNVLRYSPLQTACAYLPLTFAVGIAAGVATKIIERFGTRSVIIVGALITSAGLYDLSRIPVHGSYAGDLLPGLLIVSAGIGGVFVATATAATAGVPGEQAGLAAALLNAAQQVGAALGLAIFSAVATARTTDLLVTGSPVPGALAAGYQRALLAASVFLVGAALTALGTRNSPAQSDPVDPDLAVGEVDVDGDRLALGAGRG